MAEQEFEVLIIGAGPAGLAAALFLARFDRQVGLFDTGQGRSTWHQTNHNYLGFPGGIAARKLRELGCEQLLEYPQVTTFEHKVDALRRELDGTFTAEGQAGQWHGRAVILCMGVVDHYPHFDGWDEYVGRTMFFCITCDGYASRGQRIVVVGNTNNAASEALQLQRFSPDITVLSNTLEECDIEPKFVERLKKARIPMICDKIDEVKGKSGKFEAIYTKGGKRIELDMLFNQQGATPQTKLAEDLGVALNADGYVMIDSEQRTNIPGVFAAGDITQPYAHTINAAVYEGSAAATTANYYLYPPELKDD
jgi:thioredoxin reductase (NADPH)